MRNKERIRLALVGCGGMGLRHVRGLAELRRCGFETLDLIAVCDINKNNATYVANVAHSELGIKPQIYTHIAQLLGAVKYLDAIDLVTDPTSHHTLACAAFDAGVHVMVEKPMGVTVRACRKMIEGAERSGRTLAVAENYRRDPMNRLLKAIIDAAIVGRPYLIVHNHISGGGWMLNDLPWLHQKRCGGALIEMGVHYGDMLTYLFGEIVEIYAATAIFERRREKRIPSRFYAHRLEDVPTSIRADAEDTAAATLKFANGAFGQFTLSMAGHGREQRCRQIFGAKGSIDAPRDRSGRPIQLKLDGRDEVISEAIFDLVPEFRLDSISQRLFGFERASSYDLPFESIDGKLIAQEYQDFAEAIRDNRSPEVDGQGGLMTTAFAYALCESGHLGASVSLRGVAEDQINGYQAEINENVGL